MIDIDKTVRGASVLVASYVTGNILLSLFKDLKKQKMKKVIMLRAEYDCLKLDVE